MQSMQPTTKILERVRQNSARNREEAFTRFYRYLLRPDMYSILEKERLLTERGL
jgi:hypothetical protein